MGKNKIQQTKILLEDKILNNFTYQQLPVNWKIPNMDFSKNKVLYSYQEKALEKIASMMYLSFNNYLDDKPNLKSIEEEYEKYNYIKKENEQLNRACFWMATGSGKTLVLIKIIEYLDCLMQQNLIPKKEILILLPKDDLFRQLKEQIVDFNNFRNRQIELVDLLDYENYKQNLDLISEQRITVYYYRTDLMTDKDKTKQIDYRTYENFGNWYLFLDEAHRGQSEKSNLKFYVNELSKNGFLFNFSATFTDEIDKITTCFNYNLEKFISADYGKNIYLSDSQYSLNKRVNEFSEEEKQKQVLKSFIIYAIIKQSRNKNFYHNPLIVTLVNTVNKKNTKDSDLKIFCDYMLKIAQNKVNNKLFENAKKEIKQEFTIEKNYIFGTDNIKIENSLIDNITLEKVRKYSFNSKNSGALEYFEGIKGKEIVLKLENTDKPFALIKIGETDSVIKNYLKDYSKLIEFNNKDWMSKINEENSPINILLGSRSFYEGWDSNRPNIINMINIGKGDAKKYVPQSIGRGVRIQPYPNNKNNRKRLPFNDTNKNKLLETLFIFPTDKKSIDEILNAMMELGTKTNSNIKKKTLLIDKNSSKDKKFDLLLPIYADKESKNIKNRSLNFYVNKNSKDNFRKIFEDMSPATFLLQFHNSLKDTWTLQQYNALKEYINDSSKFVDSENKEYTNLNNLINDLKKYVNTNEKYVKEIRKIKEDDKIEENNDIIHFKHIEVEISDNKLKDIETKIMKCKNYKKFTKEEILNKLNKGEIEFEEATQLYSDKSGEECDLDNEGKLYIQNIENHYYLPLIYSENEKIEHISHIIKYKSEKDFIKNLVNNIDKIKSDWMFSKIDETLDSKNIAIPYFKDNEYKNFFPDFIFWVKKQNEYKIIFVDPKGPTYTDYQNKVDGFKDLFEENGKKKIFHDKDNNFNITFDLKLVTDNINKVSGKEYKKYWISNNNFDFLK